MAKKERKNGRNNEIKLKKETVKEKEKERKENERNTKNIMYPIFIQ